VIEIAEVDGFKIYASEDYFISFMNSPFPSHRELRAVDIFPNSREIGEIISPVSGTVVYHRVHTMRKNGQKEHVLIIDNGRYYAKILHLEPFVSIGDEIKAGEKIGLLYRSPYFKPWTDPHIHLEIRNKDDYLRARGGLELKIKNCTSLGKAELTDYYEIKDHYVLREIRTLKCGVLYGAGDRGIIDGGYPHYKFGLLLGGDDAILFGKKIGEVKNFGNYKIIKFFNDIVKWNGIEFLGIGLNIYLKEIGYIKYIFKNEYDKKKLE